MKHLLFKLQSFLVLLVFTAASAYAQKSPVDMNRFIDDFNEEDDPGRENRSVESAGYR